MKLYITGESYNFNGDGIYYLISEEGEMLASHWCSHIGFAFGDLTHDRKDEERISKWKRRFEDIDVLHLRNCKNPELIEKELIEANKKFYKEHKDAELPQKPGITITLSENKEDE